MIDLSENLEAGRYTNKLAYPKKGDTAITKKPIGVLTLPVPRLSLTIAQPISANAALLRKPSLSYQRFAGNMDTPMVILRLLPISWTLGSVLNNPPILDHNMKEQTHSPAIQFLAIQLLAILWNNRQQCTPHSWLKLNHAMREGLFLAVRMGLRFDPTDLHYCFQNFRMGYWIGNEGLESFYSEAVVYRNASAYQCAEHHMVRKAFIVPGAQIRHIHTGDGPAGGGLTRLVIGAQFQWEGETVSVTSFFDDLGYFTACSYKTEGKRTSCKKCGNNLTWPKQVLHKRYKITHAMIAAERKAKREKAKAAKANATD